MSDRPIAFFDSGIGGLPYLQRAAEALPGETFVYLADTRSFPYGEKSPAEVRRAVTEAVGRLVRRESPKVVVIACNTASVIALAELRDAFDVPFVGVVPAIKPAAAASRSRKIGVFATSRTVADAYTDQLINEFASDCSVTRIAGTEIVTFVEERLMDSTDRERMALLQPFACQFREAGVDSVVLGCTHFLHVADEFSKSVGSGIAVLDSRDGVTRQLVRVLEERGSAGGLGGRGRLFTTGLGGTVAEKEAAANERYAALAKRYGIDFMGELPDA